MNEPHPAEPWHSCGGATYPAVLPGWGLQMKWLLGGGIAHPGTPKCLSPNHNPPEVSSLKILASWNPSKISHGLCFLCSFSFWSCFLTPAFLPPPLHPCCWWLCCCHPAAQQMPLPLGGLYSAPHVPKSHAQRACLAAWLSPGICLSFMHEFCLVCWEWVSMCLGWRVCISLGQIFPYG